MSSPYLGEIRLVGFNFAPAGWAFCNGQLLPISENDALFNLIGTTYGGDGQQTFALPNIQSRVVLHQGNGAGLSNRVLAETGGVESVTLTASQMPAHSHGVQVSSSVASRVPASGHYPGKSARPVYAEPMNNSLNASSIAIAGGSQPHENRQPYLVLSYIISLFGIFPTQT